MADEKATAIVLRLVEFSETSYVVTMLAREFGRIGVLAKGGRRLRSNFESALDLLTLCRIVLLRKSSGGLDLLTEAQVVRRFPGLCSRLPALYAAYYVAELLADWTEENDPHPHLFDEALDALQTLAEPAEGEAVGPRLAWFELVLLRELGYSPLLDVCAACHAPTPANGPAFSASAGGVVCAGCAPRQRDRRPLSPACHEALRQLSASGDAWRRPWAYAVRAELRQVLGGYVTYLLGRRPRLLPYLQGS